MVDDHPLIQVALKHVLEELDDSLELFQAHDAGAARDVLALSPDVDVIVLDLTLPGCDGFEFLRELRREWPGIPVLVLSATHDRATIESALDMGAMGFIPKTANAQLLLAAMRLVLAGGVYVPTENSGFDGLRPRPTAKPSELGLTMRQADVLKLLVQGKPNKLICRDLRLSEGTVKVHVSAILRVLNVHTRTQVVIELARRGVRLEPPIARALMPMAFAAIRPPAGFASRRIDPALGARVRADQIATLFTQWRRTTASMLLGASILTVVMWGTAPPFLFAAWLLAIAANQAWRYRLANRYRAAVPAPMERLRWGRAWALGSTIAGALWGVAGVILFVPGDVGHQALLIVCLFGVVLGGVDLTAVYKPSFYGFVLPAIVPLIVRVALGGDQVHTFLAAVMLVVLAFVLRSGHNLNNLMMHSLAIRYDNLDLIRELKEQTAAADTARADAEQANHGKTEFLAAASHDLRQPLHAMGLLAAALSAKVREPEVRDIVGSINLSVEALERLFSALMDISKLDAGAVAPVRAAFALDSLFARIERQFAPLAASRGLRLSLVRTRVWIESDPVLLERVLANLVANALHYTEHGGVVVGARRRSGQVWVDVVDSGIGIAAADHDRIFDEFYRAGTARDNSRQGMGLGLAIVRRLAGLLKHPVEFASAPGRGSRFSVAVPRAPAIAVAAAPQRDHQTAASSSLSGALIAVIEDEPSVVEGMRACLTQWGATVVGAASANAILANLGDAGRYPDLIIADYRLAAGELGTEVIERLRDEFGVTIPAMLVSGDASTEAISAMRASRLDMLLKPVVAASLRDLAERLLEPACAAAPTATAGPLPDPQSGAEE